MTHYSEYNPHRRLDFSEVNIVSENRMFREKTAFLKRLSDLQGNTSDPILLRDLKGLYEKINRLEDSEFELLLADADSGVLLFPPNYELPGSN